MVQLQQLNLMAMYFIYGLSFYTMGIAIAFQYRSYSSFRLANSLRLLAAFGILHGLSEWGNVFIPVAAPILDIQSVWKAIALQRLLQSVSLFFLFLFGIKLIYDCRNRSLWLFSLPVTSFASWLIQFAFFIPLLGTNELAHWLLISENWSRFLLAFPGGVFTAVGLALQIPEAKNINENGVLRNLWISTGAFFLFSLFSGIVVPERTGWLSQMINVQTFREHVGLPIEVFRTATALMATRSITRVLTIFDLEKQRQILESRRLEAVYRERERFARDLHDDVIQSIYGIGLELQTTLPLLDSEQKKASQRVNSAVKRLNEVIQGLRAYIQGLEAPGSDRDLRGLLLETVDQFRNQFNLEIEFDYQLDRYSLEQRVKRADNWQRQLRQIVHEALTNVVQHAMASRAHVQVRVDGKTLLLTVRDNGQGLLPDQESGANQNRKHMGLQNMRTRARLLGGTLELTSEPGVGTTLVVNIPLHHV